jgi:cellulose 1,4-beta-cellobiosidase
MEMVLTPRMPRPPGKGYPVRAGHFQAASGHRRHRQGLPRRGPRFAAITLVIVLAGGVAACGGPPPRAAATRPADSPSAAVAARLCGQAGWPQTPVEGGAYVVQNDEWNSTAAECITTDGHAQFTVASSAIRESASGDPGGYPSIYSGCSAGVCTAGNKMPIRVGQLKPGMITSSWVTTQPPDGAYDVAYDIWFNRTPATSGAPDGGELMIWLAHRGGSQIAPAGAPVAHVAIDGYAFTLWLWTDEGGQHRISYVMDHPVRSVRDLDVSGVAADAARRGYFSAASYLLNVQAGFEIWQGGRGLGTESFALSVAP